MFTLYALSRFITSVLARDGVRRLMHEAATLLQALASPGKLVAEVEAMRALQVEADRIEAAQPARAAVLRRQAALIGLR